MSSQRRSSHSSGSKKTTVVPGPAEGYAVPEGIEQNNTYAVPETVGTSCQSRRW